MVQGLDALEYKEHIDYDIVTSTHKEHNKAILRLNIFRQHRQVSKLLSSQHATLQLPAE